LASASEYRASDVVRIRAGAALTRIGELFAYAERLPIRNGAWILALLLFAVYVCFTAIDARRLLWHDELFTYYIANAPTLAQCWQDLHLDLNPPLIYIAVRASIKIFGDNLYATRLPSILMFFAGSMCFYKLISDRLRPIYGALTVLIVWTSAYFYYATEARPYALVVGFFGIALLAWANVARPARNPGWIGCLFVAGVGMMFSHFFAIFYLCPIFLAEAVRVWERRKLDVFVWTALILPCAIPIAYLSVISHYEKSIFPPAFQARAEEGVLFYWDALKAQSLPLLLALAAATLISYPQARSEIVSKTKNAVLGARDAAAVLGLLLIPLLISLALLRSHAAFFERYALLAEFAFAIVCCAFLATRTGAARVPAAAASLILLLFFVRDNVGYHVLRSHWTTDPTSSAEQSRQVSSLYPDLPVVAASGLTFLEMDHYASPSLVHRLYYLTDRQLATSMSHASIFEGFAKLKKYFPIRASVEPYREFVIDHPRFLVLGTMNYPEDWLLPELLKIHATVQFLGTADGPYKDRNLFLVTMPSQSFGSRASTSTFFASGGTT
jgi:hypothetical protein